MLFVFCFSRERCYLHTFALDNVVSQTGSLLLPAFGEHEQPAPPASKASGRHCHFFSRLAVPFPVCKLMFDRPLAALPVVTAVSCFDFVLRQMMRGLGVHIDQKSGTLGLFGIYSMIALQARLGTCALYLASLALGDGKSRSRPCRSLELSAGVPFILPSQYVEFGNCCSPMLVFGRSPSCFGRCVSMIDAVQGKRPQAFRQTPLLLVVLSQ